MIGWYLAIERVAARLSGEKRWQLLDRPAESVGAMEHGLALTGIVSNA